MDGRAVLGTTATTPLPRRRFLQALGAAVAAGGLGSGCGAAGPIGTAGPGEPIRIGFISPMTGALAPFGAADQFVVDAMTRHFARNPVVVGGKGHPVQILVRDSQSNPVRAADLAADLIQHGGIHLMLVAATPETSHPVSDQCESAGMPCLATVTPWQPWFFGRAGRPDAPFRWTYNFFWGIDDVEAVYADMWDQVRTNRTGGGLWPDDIDGRAWGDPTAGFPAEQSARGYRIVDTGTYQHGTEDFSRLIRALLTSDSQILVGVPQPPEFTAFWKQATQLGYQPRIATIGKALLFPSSVEALGELGVNLSTEVWWSPDHPFTSSLTGQSAGQLAQDYTATTGRQWIQPIGFAHALFEVAARAFAAVPAVDDRAALVGAISQMKIDTVVGPLDWSAGPVPNVATTPLVGGQWRSATSNPFELKIVSNLRHPAIPAAGVVEPLSPTRSGTGAAVRRRR